MSADNYFYVAPLGRRFVVVMRFASGDYRMNVAKDEHVYYESGSAEAAVAMAHRIWSNEPKLILRDSEGATWSDDLSRIAAMLEIEASPTPDGLGIALQAPDGWYSLAGLVEALLGKMHETCSHLALDALTRSAASPTRSDTE